MIDTDPKSVKYHQDNTIILDKWTGDIQDRTLWDLIPFLLSMYNCTKLQQISSLSLSLSFSSLSLSFTAIAASQVDDVRPVLNNFKSEGERNILETFKVRQAQLRAEEERQREAMAKRSSHVGGSVPMFRLGGLGFGHHHGQHHKQQQQQQQPQSQVQPSSTAVGDQSGSGITGTGTDSDSSTSGQSWVQWIGSWIGWK